MDEERSHSHHLGVNRAAASATLHCLTGCAIGEVLGFIIGAAVGLSAGWTIALAVGLAFLFGYSLSILPLLRGGLAVGTALRVVLAAALDLLVRGVSDFESIDRTWMITLGTNLGPFGMMDRMGLGVVHHVAQLVGEDSNQGHALESARHLDAEFLQKGHLGVSTGQGFYSYPDPAFTQPGFI